MADDEQPHGVPETFLFIGGLLVVLVVLWFINGGPERGDIKKGIFINPLQPLGDGEVYGPTIPTPGEKNATTSNQ